MRGESWVFPLTVKLSVPLTGSIIELIRFLEYSFHLAGHDAVGAFEFSLSILTKLIRHFAHSGIILGPKNANGHRKSIRSMKIPRFRLHALKICCLPDPHLSLFILWSVNLGNTHSIPMLRMLSVLVLLDASKQISFDFWPCLPVDVGI